MNNKKGVEFLRSLIAHNLVLLCTSKSKESVDFTYTMLSEELEELRKVMTDKLEEKE